MLDHVRHYIATVDDQDLAKMLTALRLKNGSELEQVLSDLRRQGMAKNDSVNKKKTGKLPASQIKLAQKISALRDDPSSESEDLNPDLDSDEDDIGNLDVLMKLYATLTKKKFFNKKYDKDRKGSGDLNTYDPCPHCGSTRHSPEYCWKTMTCDECGRKGHPSERCFFVCKACGKDHQRGECEYEEMFENLRQWFKPEAHQGILPPSVEKVLKEIAR